MRRRLVQAALGLAWLFGAGLVGCLGRIDSVEPVEVIDGDSAGDGDTANHPPVIGGVPATRVVAGSPYTFQPVATDTDGDLLVFFVVNRPTWASFDAATGQLWGTPRSADVGITAGVAIRVSDGMHDVSLPAFDLEVAAFNTPPTLSGTPPTTILVGTPLSFTPQADDADGDTLVFDVTNRPSWAAFDTTTGRLSGTPAVTDIGIATGITIGASDGIARVELTPFDLTVSCPDCVTPTAGAPRVLFTDVIAGPNAGGRDDLGAYLSIFGLHFGDAAGLGTTTRVYIGDVEVGDYLWLGEAKAQPMSPGETVQQIGVRVGALGDPTPGQPLPIRVAVDDVSSNTDRTFIVQPGPIYYVAPRSDGLAGDGSADDPFAALQTNNDGGAYGAMTPGAFVVMMAGTYSDVGLDNGSQCYYFRFYDRTGNAPTGAAGHGYIAIVADPGSDVIINVPEECHGGIVGTSGSFADNGQYVVISGLTLHGNSTLSLPADGSGNRQGDGPLNGAHNSAYWRVVNNEVTFDCGTEIVRAGGISGQMPHAQILGNHIHDIGGTTLNHGIYFDDGMAGFEVAYNQIHDARGGNLIQAHASSGAVDGTIHHNAIYDGSRYGLNFGSGARTIDVSDNLIYDTDYAGIRSDSTAFDGWVVHNTLFNVNRVAGVGPTGRGAIATSSNVSYSLVHNIVWISPASDGPYLNPYAPFGSGFHCERNLWYGASDGAPALDVDPVGDGDEKNPGFVSTAAGSYDLRLVSSSPAIEEGLADVGVSVTTDGWGRDRIGVPDVGAYEYSISNP